MYSKKESGRGFLFFCYFPLFSYYFQLGLFFTNYPPSGTSWSFASESRQLKHVKRQTLIYHQVLQFGTEIIDASYDTMVGYVKNVRRTQYLSKMFRFMINPACD